MMISEALAKLLERAHAEHKVIVLVTGVFDLLHDEHMNFLRKAKAAGDILIVGLESDVRVRQMKGEGRPIYSQEQRRNHLEAMNIADDVFILPEQFSLPAHHDELIRTIRPSILAVSSHTAHQKEKAAIVEKYGGQLVVVHEHNPNISTTQLLGH